MTAIIILPPREVFSPQSAGAISLVVARHAAFIAGTIVIGQPIHALAAAPQMFPGITYHPVANMLGLIRTLRRLRPATIDIHQQPRLALSLSYAFPRARILLFLHNDPLTMRGLRSRFGRRLALRRLHRVVCVSAYLKSRFMAGLNGPGPATLPNPLTLAQLPPPAATRAPEILFAGRIVPDKAPDSFIAACAIALPNLPGWRAHIIGGDRFGTASPETPYVKKISAAAAAANIGFAGPRPHAEVLAAMAGAAIVVVPSRWAEPFGLTALEAIASGAALIATAQGGLPEIAGEAALYVPPDDPAALAAAIIKLATNTLLRNSLAAAGQERARNFDTPVIAAALEKLRQPG